MILKGCLYEPYRAALPGDISLSNRFLIHFPDKNGLRLHETRTSPTRRDLAFDKARSRPSRAGNFLCKRDKEGWPS